MGRWRWVIYLLLALGGVVLVARLAGAWRAQPQLPADEAVFRSVDALFTAVTAHDSARLAACQRDFMRHQQTGKLPERARRRLDAIIARSERGEWDEAAEQLYDFMAGQRRGD